MPYLITINTKFSFVGPINDEPTLNRIVRLSKYASAPWSARVVVYCLSVASSSLVWRNYTTFTEGWWHVYVIWMRAGRKPYNDFELLVPPAYPYILRLISNFVGMDFLSLRVVGLLVRVLRLV